jgi:phosphoribosylanthranilate isomerase
MKIKVCGLKYPENIKAVSDLNPDYMGFICYAASPRFINELSPEVLKAIPPNIQKTAVFVNEGAETINNLIEEFGINAIQLHGNESPEFCGLFNRKVSIFKAFGIDENFDFERLNDYVGKVDFFLFDTKTPVHGGSGKSFDWGLLEKYKLNVPFFLSGGISLENLEELNNISHPEFYGVDLNSKFEVEPGLKVIEKLEKAFEIIKHGIQHELRS